MGSDRLSYSTVIGTTCTVHRAWRMKSIGRGVCAQIASSITVPCLHHQVSVQKFWIDFMFVSGVVGLQITDLRVPHSVRNGSVYAILDCEYALLPEDTSPNSGLVVKWFFNRQPSPVYQWIPGKWRFVGTEPTLEIIDSAHRLFLLERSEQPKFALFKHA